MIQNRVYILVLVFVMLSLTVFAQGKKPDKDMDKALKYLNEKNYEKALEIYLQEYQAERLDKYALRIADMYHRLNQNEKSLQWFKDVKYLDKADKKYLLIFADVNKELGYLKPAFDYYMLYAIEANDAEGVYEKAYATENLLKASKKSVLYQLKKLPFNTDANDNYVGALRNNQIVASDRDKSSKELFPLTDFYILQREYDKWLNPVKVLKAEVKDTSRTSLSYTADGNTVFFTQTPYSINKNYAKGYAEGKSQIVTAKNTGNKWSEISELPLNDLFSNKDPSVDAEGNTMFFASNMPGGFGGYDLYKMEKTNGVWGKPKNLGQDVNSKYDEILPFIRQDENKKVLYFTNDSPEGFGGWDIYQCSYEIDKWTNVEILPPPINSSADDRSIIFDLNNQSGYFTSNRNGGAGGFDIYRFEPFDLKIEVKANDQTLGVPLGFAEINLFLDDIAIDQALTNTSGSSILQVGKNLNYVIVVQKPGYKQVSQKISTSNKNNGETITISYDLEQEPKYKNTNTLPPSSAQNTIVFKGVVVAKDKGKIPFAKIRMINMDNGKIKELESDINGKFEQLLFINKTYKIYINKGDYKLEDDITTFAMEEGSEMFRDFVFKQTADVFALLDKNNPKLNNPQVVSNPIANKPPKQEPTPTVEPPKQIQEPVKPIITTQQPLQQPVVINQEPIAIVSQPVITTQEPVGVSQPPILKVEPTTQPIVNEPVAVIEQKVIPIVETPTAKIEEEQPIVPNKEVVNVPLKSSDLLAVNNVPTSNSDVSKIENLLIYKIQLGAYQERDIDFSRFDDLGKVDVATSNSGQFIYTLGDFSSLDEAKRKLEAVRENGMFVAFIIGYLKNEKVGIYR
ncbi:MAG: PD40 domain-containing protein [Bacteroidetes bacterium]|jgi:tetratricopeptide (TPR) repeat protein|nr:PD40 domain-containing protein [Bacteroidota bacterium]